MKVKDLIDLLKNHHGESEVIMSSDGEGNRLMPLYSISIERVSRYGDDPEREFDDESGTDAVVFWPVY